MKKIKALLFVGLLMLLCQAAGRDARINFDNMTYDFGVIHESAGPVSTEFRFTNSGDAPLVIVSASASCGCTRPTFPEKPVAPGKSGKIKVTYNPAGRPGEFSKTVKVRTNAKNGKKINLKITGTVVPKD